MKNYYDILKIKSDATQDDIKKAFRELAKKLHPDKGGNEDDFKELNEAYENLSDENKRKEYDAKLNPQKKSPTDYTYDFYNSGFSDIYDILRQEKKKYREESKNNGVTINTEITIDDFFKGCSKKFNIKHDGTSTLIEMIIPKFSTRLSTKVLLSNKQYNVIINCRLQSVKNSYYNYYIVNGKLVIIIDYKKAPNRITLDLPFIDQVISFNKPNPGVYINGVYMKFYHEIEIQIEFES